MKSHRHSDRSYVTQQHKIRGLISDYRSHEFTKGKTSHSTSNFRSAIRELFLDARVSLRQDQFSDFLEWVENQIKAQLPELEYSPIGYGDLSGIFTEAPKATLELELCWITERIKVATSKINSFRLKAEEVEFLALKGDFEAAIEKLQIIESEFGASIWAVQLRIALEQQAGGLERQKRYSAEVKGMFRRGLLTFIGYYASVRNEDKTTLGKYFEDVKERIGKHRYFESFVKTYLRYQLACESPISAAGFADILRVEQSHSLIDVYETFISVIQEVVRNDSLEKYREDVAKCLHTLIGVQDYRLAKALLVIEGGAPAVFLEKRDTSVSDALLAGDVKVAAMNARRRIKATTKVDPWLLIYSGFAFGHTTRERLSEYGRLQDISCLIGKILSRCEGSFEALITMAKLAVNFGGLPVAVGIIEFLQQLQRSHPDDELRPWLIGLNSPFIGIEDFSPDDDSICIDRRVVSKNNTPTECAWSSFQSAVLEETVSAHQNIYLFTAAGLIRMGDYQKAIDLISANNFEQGPEPVRTIAVSLMLHANFAVGDRENVISLIADEGSRSKAHRQLLPIRAALESYQWDDYKTLPAPLSAPVALHLLWVENESSKTASLLRFAIRKVLSDSEIELPSKLYDYAENYPKHQLIYFLRKVCKPNLLDHARAIKSTRMLMEERQAICAALRLLDPVNADAYGEEVSFISYQQAMDEGQWIVDRTRIHVDTDALKRWAKKELLEAFNRYRDLLEVDVDASLELDDVLKEMMSESIAKQKTFVPETEADAVLMLILRQLSDEFLNNSSFGLDFYLSKRIRHQSFIGLIRGPVEFTHLITTRVSETGGYHKNEEWLGKFVNASSESKEAINDAFTKFAIKFDGTLTAAKENSFQILSLDKPNGLVYLNLSPQIIFLLRSITQMDETLFDFINTVVEVLWAAIEPSLTQVRRLINEDIKTQIAEAFDELQTSIKKHAGHEDPAFLALALVIGKCSTEVQAQLDVATQWFTRMGDVDLNDVRRVFELEQMVNIAIESALKCQRTFEPSIHIDVSDGDTQMATSTLVFLHDVMFVALDNVNAYSGLKKPKVTVMAEVNSETGTFKLCVRNEAKNQNRAETDKKLNEIRDLIDNKNYERRTRREGRSGFLKLAAVVQQNTKGYIDFGYTEESEFQLTVIYSLIIQPKPLEVSNE